jgi:hypothetical protein
VTAARRRGGLAAKKGKRLPDDTAVMKRRATAVAGIDLMVELGEPVESAQRAVAQAFKGHKGQRRIVAQPGARRPQLRGRDSLA